jgi:signal transduction histidine kinase
MRNKAGDSMQKSRSVLSAIAYIILVCFVLAALALLMSHTEQESVRALSGYADLSAFDFSSKLAYISYTGFQYYPDALYSPEDFHADGVQAEPITLRDDGTRYDIGDYGTYRITVRLPAAGETYGLSSFSAMYAQRLFVNGREYAAAGAVGDTAETTVPKSTRYTVYFTPETDEIEIIIQFANFVHADFGGLLPVYLGSQDTIRQRDAIAQQRVHVLTGCALTAFLFFMGMFLFFRRQNTFLWFSLICLSSGLRLLIMDEKAIMLMFPELPWRISIGMEYAALIVLMLSVLMYIHGMFRGALHKAVLWAFGGVCALYAAVVLLTPPILYTRYILWFEVCAAAAGVYTAAALVYNVARRKDNRHLEHALILVGALAYIALSILNIHVFYTSNQRLALGLTETGMVVMILINMIALMLRFSRIETELARARRMEMEMRDANLLLDRMSRARSDFLANLSHELRTPLTVMSSYAGLTSLEIRRKAVNEKTLENLDVIKSEAARLAELVEQLKKVSVEKECGPVTADIEALPMLKRTAAFCAPICNRNGNEIRIHADPQDILLCGNPETIFQTLVNLIINSNRHTKNGVIRISVVKGEQAGFAELSVSDNGNGIDPALLPDIFKRGVSGDGSSGLGLPISKEIVEEHGGKIWIESEISTGTVVRFTIPYGKGEPA